MAASHYKHRGKPLSDAADLDDSIRELWKAWKRGELSDVIRICMHVQWIADSLVFDRQEGPSLDKLAAIEKANYKPPKKSNEEILAALARFNYKVSLAADYLDISRQTIYDQIGAEQLKELRK